MSEDIFDFGFTAVDEKELEVVQKTAASAEEAAASATVAPKKICKLLIPYCFLICKRTARGIYVSTSTSSKQR